MRRLPKPPNSSRHHLHRELEKFAGTLQEESTVLDVGAGSALYAPVFSAMRYLTSDFRQNENGTIDIVGDMSSIDLPDASVDAIVCTQALHASTNPSEVLREFRRLLRRDGRAFVSTVFAYPPVDEPFDCFRITPHGMRSLADEAQLRISSAVPMEGYFGTVSNQLVYASQQLPTYLLPIRAMFWVLAHGFARADISSPRHDLGHPKNYIFVLEN